MADLYEVLGVESDAPQEAIRRAWKRVMKRTHPDMPGGSRKAFDLAQTALTVLSNPKARERYDRTGEFDTEPPVDNETAAINELLSDCLQAVIAGTDINDAALTRIDLVEKVRAILAQPREQTAAIIKNNARVRQRAEKVRGRFRVRADGKPSPLIDSMIAFRISRMDAQDEKCRKILDRCDKVEELLSAMMFEEEPDEPANLRAVSYYGMAAYSTAARR